MVREVGEKQEGDGGGGVLKGKVWLCGDKNGRINLCLVPTASATVDTLGSVSWSSSALPPQLPPGRDWAGVVLEAGGRYMLTDFFFFKAAVLILRAETSSLPELTVRSLEPQSPHRPSLCLL